MGLALLRAERYLYLTLIDIDDFGQRRSALAGTAGSTPIGRRLLLFDLLYDRCLLKVRLADIEIDHLTGRGHASR